VKNVVKRIVYTPQNNAAYFHQSRFQSIPTRIETRKNAATNIPTTISEWASNAFTDAESVGIVTFNLDLSQSIGKAVAIGNTNVPIRINRSKARSFGSMCER